MIMPDLNGQSIGRYRILEPLGEGGMAKVYKAYDTRLECKVAIKFIRHDQVPPVQWERMRMRFEHEAKRMAKFNHPHIVRVTDYGEHEGMPYLVMPYLPGGTLKELLKAQNNKPMDYREASRYLAPIARALEYAHQQETIHRDVKPANILLTEAGQPMLTDFGVAKILDVEEGQSLTGTGVGIGTPKYMAPEQWQNKISPQTDVYSLGVVLYEMVTGRLPYNADTPAAVLSKQLSEPLPPPRKFNPSLPVDVEKVIYKALAKDTRERYPNMQPFAQVLEQLAGTVMVQAPSKQIVLPSQLAETMDTPPPSGRRISSTRRPAKPNIWLIALLVITIIFIGFLMIGGIGVLWIITPNSTQDLSKSQQQLTQLALTKSILETTHDIVKEPSASATIEVEKKDQSIDSDFSITMNNSKDGSVMVHVPAGEFLMGSIDKDIQALDSEKPQHAVYLEAYWINKTEITNELYKKCVDEGTCSIPLKVEKFNNPAFANYPIEYVNWEQASAYCGWAGGKLPSEAEWEKAARGTDGRNFPWGNKAPTKDLLNYKDSGMKGSTEVGSYPNGASPYGALDMVGNVQEWVQDWYAGDYYRSSPKENPPGAETGNSRVIRGSSWRFESALVRLPLRMYFAPTSTDFDYKDIGFRCVRSP